MSPVELRASVSLAAIFGLRLLGMFVILPVFAIHAEQLPGGTNLTREEQRTKSMAMIGSTIGLAFAFSLVVSPWLNGVIGVAGLFTMTGVLALAAMLVVWRVVPGYLYGRFGLAGVVIAEVMLLVIWLMAAAGMKAPNRPVDSARFGEDNVRNIIQGKES